MDPVAREASEALVQALRSHVSMLSWHETCIVILAIALVAMTVWVYLLRRAVRLGNQYNLAKFANLEMEIAALRGDTKPPKSAIVVLRSTTA